MNEIEELRALLAEARKIVGDYECIDCGIGSQDLWGRIKSALAKPVVDEVHQRLIDAVCHYRAKAIMLGAKPSDMITEEDRRLCQQRIPADIATTFDVTDVWDDLEKAESERDGARAEIERLVTRITALESALASISLDEYESTSSASEKVHGHARIARRALYGEK